MILGLVGSAVATFAVTNVDDLLLLALHFDRAARRRRAVVRVIVGQYLGLVAILAVSVLGASGAALLPPSVVPYLGILPILLGLRAAWEEWRRPRPARQVRDREPDREPRAPGVLEVAGVTIANGGDNVAVYIPLFATIGVGGQVVYNAVFLVLAAVWCAAGRYLATRTPVARALTRGGRLVLPVVLVGIGVTILVGGGAFGLG